MPAAARWGITSPTSCGYPASLVHQLIHVAGVPEDEVASMSLERAIDVMAAHRSQPKQ
jgi:hypothetical protein